MPRKFKSLQEKRTHQSWADMRNRCNNPNNHAYTRYGGRGIKCDPRWEHYRDFVADMGLKPDGKTLERVDNNRGYSPENCVWASYREQGRNTRVNRLLTHDGVTLTAVEWSERLGINFTTLRNRLNAYGWSVEKALTTPVNHNLARRR